MQELAAEERKKEKRASREKAAEGEAQTTGRCEEKTSPRCSDRGEALCTWKGHVVLDSRRRVGAGSVLHARRSVCKEARGSVHGRKEEGRRELLVGFYSVGPLEERLEGVPWLLSTVSLSLCVDCEGVVS